MSQKSMNKTSHNQTTCRDKKAEEKIKERAPVSQAGEAGQVNCDLTTGKERDLQCWSLLAMVHY